MYYEGTNQKTKVQRSRKIEKERTRKMRKDHTPFKESVQEKRLNLWQRTFTTLKTSCIPFTPNALNQAMRH